MSITICNCSRTTPMSTTTIYNCSRTTPMSAITVYNCSRTTLISATICNAKGQFQWTSTTITMPKDNFNNNFNNNNNAKDNSLDLEKLAKLTMICCSQIFESGKVFCDSIPNVGIKKDPSFYPFPTFC